MKPRIFIGSSVEALDVSYAIQTNLAFDATVTVWTQGVFQLSSNSLDDLIKALDNFDFGIFVFRPDDLLQIRAENFNVVRDNVIFELGLFFGKLGKERVFFVMPNSTQNFRLPTDLLGVLYGKYDDEREDGNLQAALGVFCNQVRQRLTTFVYDNLHDLAGESKVAKKIAIEKKDFWEIHLCAALLRERMIEINRSADEIRKGYVFKSTVDYDLMGANQWFQHILADYTRLIKIAKTLYETELSKSFGEPGVSGNIFEIKSVVEKITRACKELLSIEIEVQSVRVPQEFAEIQQLIKGWSDIVIKEFSKLPDLLNYSFSEENIKKGKPIEVVLTFDPPPNNERILSIISKIERGIQMGNIKF